VDVNTANAYKIKMDPTVLAHQDGVVRVVLYSPVLQYVRRGKVCVSILLAFVRMDLKDLPAV
jgi:hypothetical protein